ncbi:MULTISPECIES: ABC transporter ATP-binding protein [Clostridium]|uniref:ABC transporter ATP-binding protein n=1 Tax=Clostridium TaxID=1485 RepID=UPI000825AD1E|nr:MULTISPECIES: dipeptide ABC transporter ATP-binding protein [Clostridium]PJI09281.1 ABC transporter ATP-binding protein [Clostridium sp. CT7]
MAEKEIVLKIENLKKYFPVKNKSLFSKERKYIKAVDGVSFEVYKGETLGIVGESGCGKSTTGKLIMHLINPTSGDVIFKGKKVSKNEIKEMRKNIQMVFQDPYASLDPRQIIYKIIEEPMIVYGITDKEERKKRVSDLLKQVGLQEYHGLRYPHEFSGGQRQRINIARALVLSPDIVVCDEPVSALDVSIQAQIINLLKKLQKDLGLTYIFIAHDLSVVKHISDRIIVMYLGKIMEIGDYNQVYNNPHHPYTKALLSAIPASSPRIIKKKDLLEGDLPSPLNPPTGCVFNTRCNKAMDICRREIPEYVEVENGHCTACHLYGGDK